MREPKSAMQRPASSVYNSLAALYLILVLMISHGRLARGSKEQKPSGVQLFSVATSNNSFLPLETSKSINRRLTSNSTNQDKRQPNESVNFSTHEASSSSTQQSFFDVMNQEKDPVRDTNFLIGIAPESSESNFFTSDSKLINRFRQPMLMNEYDLRAQLSPIPFTQAMTGGLGRGYSGGPQVYEAQTNYPMGTSNQLENSFYVNMMGPQAMQMANDRIPDEGAASDFPNNHYANPTNDVYSPAIPHNAHQDFILSGGNLSPQDYAKQAYIMANHQRYDPTSAKDQIARGQKILTNAQIVSLIDELKEFNTRKLKEALKGKKNDPKSSRRKEFDNRRSSGINKSLEEHNNSKKSQDNDSDDDVKKSNNNNNNDDDQDSDDETERREDDSKNEDDDELKKEDLQKLASFIFEQQKENNRLLNAGRKNAGSDRDDEDTDMKDTLLENSRKSQANEEPQSSLKNSRQVPTDNNQLMELLKKLSTKKDASEDSNSYENDEKTGEQDDSDRARKRRANEEKQTPTTSAENFTINNESPLLSLINSNFNKYDRRASSITPKQTLMLPLSETSTNRRVPQNLKDIIDNPVNKLGGNLDETNSSSSSHQEGEEESEYPRSERMKDLETLRQGLARSREAQLKLSRVPLPLTPLFREALKNELTKVTDQTIVESSGSEDDKSESKDAKISRLHDEPEVGEELTNSDLTPIQAEPDGSMKKIKGTSFTHKIGEEYPISETVNDRINKLSHNLDRYFNDGFFDKPENKTSGETKAAADQEEESRVRPQIHPKKNVHKSKTQTTKTTSKDDDFDINVAIDGKRDTINPEDELNGEIEDKNKRDSIQKATIGSRRQRREKTNSGEKVKKIKRHNKEANTRVTPLKAKRNGADQEKATRDHRQLKKPTIFDPVDSETLDTPIGPDDKQSKVRGIEKSKGSKERLSNFSKNSEKFFQEPD